MPAERGGATDRDGPQGSMLDRREPVGASVVVAVLAHDRRELEPEPDHRDRRAQGHGAHGQPWGSGANCARRSSGESGPIAV